jgi:hypothetical protein
MTTRTEIFLAVIAVATLTMAVVQVGIIVVAGMLARRISKMADQVERDMRPLFAHLNAIGRDAARATALASAQVERADKLFGDLAVRVEQTFSTVQGSLGAPAREGRAIVSAFRAALQVLLQLRQPARGRQGRSEDEEALFI